MVNFQRNTMKTENISADLIDFAGSDLSVVNAARVSFHKESDWEYSDETVDILSEKDQKLINYLAKHNHWSPFAHTFLQFRCKAPIFLARQLVKHQVGGVWNEVSRRYVDEEPTFYFPTLWRKRAENVKQGSSEETLDADNDNLWVKNYDNYSLLCHSDIIELALNWYNNAIKQGVAPEQARMVLPQNTMTEWIWSGSLMFFARVYKQRSDPHAQKEAQEFAALINNSIPEEYTHSWKALTQ